MFDTILLISTLLIIFLKPDHYYLNTVDLSHYSYLHLNFQCMIMGVNIVNPI